NGDTDANLRSSGCLNGACAFTGSAVTATDVGSYTITPMVGSIAALNYDITSCVNGTLAITPATVNVAYIGQTTWVTSGTSATTAQVSLSASLQASAGLINHAVVSFWDVNPNHNGGKPTLLADNVPVSAVAGQPLTGTANKIVTLSTGQY